MEREESSYKCLVLYQHIILPRIIWELPLWNLAFEPTLFYVQGLLSVFLGRENDIRSYICVRIVNIPQPSYYATFTMEIIVSLQQHCYNGRFVIVVMGQYAQRNFRIFTPNLTCGTTFYYKILPKRSKTKISQSKHF